MAFRLADRLGMLFSELSRRCSARELMEWGVYWNLDNAPPPRQQPDVVAQLMSVFGGPRG